MYKIVQHLKYKTFQKCKFIIGDVAKTVKESQYVPLLVLYNNNTKMWRSSDAHCQVLRTLQIININQQNYK